MYNIKTNFDKLYEIPNSVPFLVQFPWFLKMSLRLVSERTVSVWLSKLHNIFMASLYFAERLILNYQAINRL